MGKRQGKLEDLDLMMNLIKMVVLIIVMTTLKKVLDLVTQMQVYARILSLIPSSILLKDIHMYLKVTNTGD